MTESEWWATTDPDTLIDWLFFDVRATDRKLRLFSVACCRRIEHLVDDAHLLNLLVLVERFADGQCPAAQLLEASQEGNRQRYQRRMEDQRELPHDVESAHSAFSYAADEPDEVRDPDEYETDDTWPYARWVASHALDSEPSHTWASKRRAQVRLLHDIFGPLPFRDVVIEPAWLTSNVVSLARGIYDNKTFDQMPILADALEDADCTNAEILKHCRDANHTHVRGCWVLDLLLGRPWRDPTP